jgi:hypothetical protein
MSAYVTGAAISATSAALGYGANALRERGARKEAARAARGTELHQALREYVAALDASMMEVEDFPMPPKMTALDRWMERKLQGTLLDLARHLVIRLLKRLVYGHRHDDLSDRLVAASARLRLVAPPQVEALMVEVEALARKYPVGDPHLLTSWKPLRERIRREFKDAVEDGHTSKLGSGVLGPSFVPHEDEQRVGDEQQRDRPGDPRADVQRTSERHDSRAERKVNDRDKPLQREMHGPRVRRACETKGVSRNASDKKGLLQAEVRWWWLLIAAPAAWVVVGGLSFVSGSSRLNLSLALVALGVISVALTALADFKSVAVVLPVVGTLAGGLATVLSTTKVSPTLGLGPDIRFIVTSGVVATALALLICFGPRWVARKIRHH